jgi:hypothetical protein
LPGGGPCKTTREHRLCKVGPLVPHLTIEPVMSSSDGCIECRLEAATALVGVIFYNSFAGRSGEWELMQRSHVKDHLDKHNTFLLCPQHKTVATYGTLAKHIPAGSWHAFRLYLDLPGKRTDRFIEPPTATSTQASVAGLLKRFGVIAFKTEDPPNSNLIRKMFHSCLLRISRDKEAMRFMEKVDAHSEHIARKVYAITTPEDDSKLAHMLYTEVFGRFAHTHSHTCWHF